MSPTLTTTESDNPRDAGRQRGSVAAQAWRDQRMRDYLYVMNSTIHDPDPETAHQLNREYQDRIHEEYPDVAFLH